MVDARESGSRLPSEDGTVGQPRVREGSAKEGRWFRLWRDVAPRKDGGSRPEIDSRRSIPSRCRRDRLLHSEHRGTCRHRHAARRLIGLVVSAALPAAIRATGRHLAVRHVRHRRRLSLRHEDARCGDRNAIPGKAEKNAQAQQMTEQLQHGTLMRRDMARVNSRREPIGLQTLVWMGQKTWSIGQ